MGKTTIKISVARIKLLREYLSKIKNGPQKLPEKKQPEKDQTENRFQMQIQIYGIVIF